MNNSVFPWLHLLQRSWSFNGFGLFSLFFLHFKLKLMLETVKRAWMTRKKNIAILIHQKWSQGPAALRVFTTWAWRSDKLSPAAGKHKLFGLDGCLEERNYCQLFCIRLCVETASWIKKHNIVQFGFKGIPFTRCSRSHKNDLAGFLWHLRSSNRFQRLQNPFLSQRLSEHTCQVSKRPFHIYLFTAQL